MSVTPFAGWRIAGLLLAFCLPPVAAAARPLVTADLDAAFSSSAIVIETGSPACYAFDVYVAVSGAQQRRGLMFVRDLASFTGMLFVYEEAASRSMWMKNTFIPLDILFIRPDGTVSSVAQDTEPLSLRSISSSEPVQYVLELNAGVAESLHIDDGTRVLMPGDLATSE